MIEFELNCVFCSRWKDILEWNIIKQKNWEKNWKMTWRWKMKKKTKSFSKKSILPFKALISVKFKHFEILFGLGDVSFKYLPKNKFAENFLKASSSQKHEKTRFWPIFLLRFRHKAYGDNKKSYTLTFLKCRNCNLSWCRIEKLGVSRALNHSFPYVKINALSEI